MFKAFLLSLVFTALFTAQAAAQTVLSVDITKATLAWAWQQGTGSPADGFNVKCGTATGVYSKVNQVKPSSVLEYPVLSAIAGPGTWFCVVTAFNEFGETSPTNEVTFKAGTLPGDPNKLIIKAN